MYAHGVGCAGGGAIRFAVVFFAAPASVSFATVLHSPSNP